MGVIKKKTATRGTEGGVKYVCDVCAADITSTVRIRCADSICKEYDLCVPCFSDGAHTKDHDPQTHSYTVVEQHSIPIYDEGWGADEEMLLLEGAETYGLGSWADIADHIGGYRTKDEVRDHYLNTYIKSSKFPLPERASPDDRELLEIVSREEFQARKKRRIEDRKETARNAIATAPKQKQTASVPACHEVQGYMPGRMEFEHEYMNDAEEAVQHMQFEPGDGINPLTGELDPEVELKLTVMDIYNTRLTARVDRKKVMFEHKLLEYRKNMAVEKNKSKEEKDILTKAKPFARMMDHSDFKNFGDGLLEEYNLRLAIAQLQEWRNVGVKDLKGGEKYEKDKKERLQKSQAAGMLDRLGTSRPNKAATTTDSSTIVQAMVAPSLHAPYRPKPFNPADNPRQVNGTNGKVLANGHTNGVIVPQFDVVKHPMTTVSNIQPMELNNENANDLHLLSADEKSLCSSLRILPKPYLTIKEALLRESMKSGGKLKKKTAREICKIDVNKGSKIYEFFINAGWIARQT